MNPFTRSAVNPFTKSAVNQLTKGLVIASTLIAAGVELYLVTSAAYAPLLPIAIVGFVVAALAGTRWPGQVSMAILLLPYLARAVVLYAFGTEFEPVEIVWAFPLLGLILSGRGAWQWNFSSRFCWPLIAWSLVIAVSWPIVFLRELDFDSAVLYLSNAATTSIGILPWEAGTGVAYWVLVHNLGILWFDRLFSWFPNGSMAPFRNRVLFPLLTALAVACCLATYQGFVDLTFLNPHLWPHMNRASGTFGDANVFGMIAALWIPGAVLLARTLPRPWSALVGTAGVTLAALGVFTSGSRTALGVMAIGSAALAYQGFKAWQRAEINTRLTTRRLALIVVAVVVFGAVALTMTRRSAITTVIDRGTLEFIPGFGDRSLATSLRELLWDRFGYGPVAVSMIIDHPWAGVGVGSFTTLVNDFSVSLNARYLASDNAQSWYRHLLAELGVLGSIPWIVWCVIFMVTLFARTTGDRDRFSLGVLRATLAGFGMMSMLGVPGQSLPVVLTLWTLVFWFLSVQGTAVEPSAARDQQRSGLFWVAALGLVAAHSAITFADARGDLRPRNRAIRFGWEYAQGIGDLERSANGSPGRRWTERRAITQVPVKGRSLKFVGWVDHPDADENPVHVKVWADSRLVFEGDLKRPPSAVNIDIPATPGKSHLLLETEVSRVWWPRTYGHRDPRQLGLSIRDWLWE